MLFLACSGCLNYQQKKSRLLNGLREFITWMYFFSFKDSDKDTEDTEVDEQEKSFVREINVTLLKFIYMWYILLVSLAKYPCKISKKITCKGR